MFNKHIAAITAVITSTIVMGLMYMFYPEETSTKVTQVQEVEIYSIRQIEVVQKDLPPLRFKYANLAEYDRKQIDCLAKNMYHEAGFEPRDGIYAVGMVTMNRLYSGKFPRTVCEVVYHKTGNFYQFSWVAIRNRLTKIDQEVYNRILEKAVHIYFNYHMIVDVTKGALFFHADYIRPGWKREKVAHIGRHIFYR